MKIGTEMLLRAGLAFAFIYPAVSAWLDPYSWIGYFPAFMLESVGSFDMYVLHAFGFAELGIALWLLFGKKVFIPAAAAGILLILIIVFNYKQMDVLFRDVPIVLMAAALIIIEIEKTKQRV